MPQAPRSKGGASGGAPAVELAQLTVELADSGGRGLGGLPLTLRSAEGQTIAFRVGRAIAAPAGSYTLEVPVDPPVSRAVALRSGEHTALDLGRLASVIVSAEGSGAFTTAGAPFSLEMNGVVLRGHLGQEMQLWPGRYRLTLQEAGSLGAQGPLEVDARAGALNEVRLGPGPASRSARLLAAEIKGAARTLARRLGARLPSLPGLTDGPRPAKRRGVTLGDAWGRALRRRLRLEPEGGGEPMEVWSGDDAHIPAGKWRVSEVGQPGSWQVETSGGKGADVGALGALEVHLKAPDTSSLRYAPLELVGAEGIWQGRVGVPLDVPPGRYELRLTSLPGFERPVTLHARRLTKLDLGVVGVLELGGLEGASEGDIAQVWSQERAVGSAEGHCFSVGNEILLPLGSYNVQRVGGDGAPQVLKARRLKKVKPAVAVRFTGSDMRG